MNLIKVKCVIGLIAYGCVVFIPTGASAQGSSAASISGTVKDTSGAVLPGVTVETASPSLIEKVRSTVTDGRGEYRIIELRPGTYSISFMLAGFSGFKREGLQLPANFNATVNAELKVGGIAETVTVSGATPLVDTQSVTQAKSMTKELLDNVPTNKGMLAYAALMPAVITPPNVQDVGGTKGETSVRISIHGGKQPDQRLLQDGMRYNSLTVDGTGRGFLINPLGAQEIVIDVAAGGSAEYETGGAQVNLIPKDGGNVFSGAFFTSYTGHSLQGNNLTDELRSQGLTSVNGTQRVYDVNGVVGGPIRRDRLWFSSAHRRWGQTPRITDLYYDSNPDDWVFTPDLSRPFRPPEENKSHNVRVTWQVSSKHKVTASYDWQENSTYNLTNQLSSGTIAPEAQDGYCPTPRLYQATWTNPATNGILFDAGVTRVSHSRSSYIDFSCGAAAEGPDRVSIQAPGFRYHGTGNRLYLHGDSLQERFSMSYATGSQVLKVGMFAQSDIVVDQFQERNPRDARGLPLSYGFTNGVPTSLTQFVSPQVTQEHMRPDLGVFVQDRLTFDRVTLNLGLRFDYLRAWVPPVERPAGPLSDAASFGQVDCVPCWKDVNPRLGAAVDLFGDGKTALNAGLGRYVEGRTIGLASLFEPANAAVNNTTRSWTDSNSNFFPDCDLRAVGLNGECGPMMNSSFGQLQVRTNPDQDWIRGRGKRGYNWRASVEMNREIRDGVAISAGYYRTWFGNFTVTDNLDVTPADYTQYCVTAPADSRLPSEISGQRICGLYDINPDKFGSVNQVVTLASNFGKQTEVYNGADLTFVARLPGKGMLSGGWNIGNSISTTVGTGQTTSRANNCFVVDSPQQLFNCQSGNPYQNRFKLSGSYPLPWDLQAALVFQTLPGPNYGASTTFTTAQIAPSLGRPLAGGTRNVTIDLLAPFAAYLDTRINQLDLRLSKRFAVGRAKLQGNVDLYNALSASTVLGVNSTYSLTGVNTWLKPTQVLDARLVKFGVQVDF